MTSARDNLKSPESSDHNDFGAFDNSESSSFASMDRSQREQSLQREHSPKTEMQKRVSAEDNTPAADSPAPRKVHVSSVASGNLVVSPSNTSGGKPMATNPPPATSEDIVDSSTSSSDRRLLQEAKQELHAASEDIDSSPASSYEEDSEGDLIDSEVLLAKEMAMAIASNPNMTPTQLRELQQQVQHSVEQKKKDREILRMQQKGTKKKKRSVSSEIKIMKSSAKETIKETKENAKAQAKVLKKEFKKGLRAMGLMHPHASTGMDGGRPLSEIANGGDLVGFSKTGLDASSLHTTPRESLRLDEDGESIRLAGIVWKRRSGLGKYSMTASWERRRVVLKGTKLIYYKTLQETMNETNEEKEGTQNNSSPILGGYGEAFEGYVEGAAGAATGWINTLIDKSGVTIPWESTPSGARGFLDLRKEKASASASYGHTGAPTPFALSIKIGGVTKYKFCYDTQHDLMVWLAAITDVVVAGSVDDYNSEILEANDPSTHGGGVSGVQQLLTDTMSGSEKQSNVTLSQEHSVQQLWSTEQYLVKSIHHPSISNPGPQNGGGAGDEWMVDPENFHVDTTEASEIWGLPVSYLTPIFYILNVVILSARFNTVLTEENFWYVLVFFNVLIIMLVDKTMVGGTIQLKPDLENKFQTKQMKTDRAGGKGLEASASNDSTEKEAIVTSLSVDENFVPSAGSSAMRIENPKDLPTKDGVIFAGWRQVDPYDIPVRGHRYTTDKKKVPCPGALYECIELDIFESRKRVPDMAGRVVLPTFTFENDIGPKTWSAPDIFVITVALPTDPPKLYGGSPDNGGGYTITMYCKMRQKTRDILRRITADGYNPADDDELKGVDMNKSTVNACRLLDEWCRRAPADDNWMARFKVFPIGNNLDDIGLPSWISSYNGKPFLIKRPGTTGFLYRHPEKSCMEFDVSLHPFPYVAKQGICYMKDGFFKKILATLAFCIEGRSEDELPECMIGLYQLCYPNPIYGIQADDFFSGKSARSK